MVLSVGKVVHVISLVAFPSLMTQPEVVNASPLATPSCKPMGLTFFTSVIPFEACRSRRNS